MKLRFASYNIHKAVGLDRKRDPERIMAVLREVDADVIALQEADERFGERTSVLPRALIDDYPWRVVPVAKRPRSIGWHGNALLVRRDMEIVESHALELPTLEPRGAVCGTIRADGVTFHAIGTHLDLSGLRRRDQVRALLDFADAQCAQEPTMILGDFNQWGRSTGAMGEFSDSWQLLTPGRSYPSRAPVAVLDRIVACGRSTCIASKVHRTALATIASDHLPVYADLDLPQN
jgi:endonuclease/exonuclease/phosphatase family metal-dependent hydrolase